MHQLGSLIVELERARRKLQNVFEVQNGALTSEDKTRPILNGPVCEDYAPAGLMPMRAEIRASSASSEMP
jgi:hypothetical protein